MSDHSSSTGSSGSSTNSWTLLSPEEAAAENAATLDDGTESLGDAPSLSEDMAAGVVEEIKPSDIPAECVLSQEGHEVCQETAPECGDGATPCCPLPEQFVAPDPESQAPIIHDIVTSSPSDNEHLGVAYVSSIDFGAPRDVAEPEETLGGTEEPEPVLETVIPTETVTTAEPILHEDTDVNQEQPEPPVGPAPTDDVIEPESIGSVQEEEEGTSELEMNEELVEEASASCHGDGLRKRAFRSESKGSDVEDEDEDDEDEEEMEFRLPKKKEKAWWSVNKCIVGAAVLLFLGALFLSGDFEAGDMSDTEQSQGSTETPADLGLLVTNEIAAEFKAVLDMFDTDGSGDISTKELGTVLRMLGEHPLRKELNAIIQEVKEDGDKRHWKSHEKQDPKRDVSKRWSRVWEHLEKIRREISDGVERLGESKEAADKSRKDERKEKAQRCRDEWETKKWLRRENRQNRRKQKPWRSHQKQHATDLANFWRVQELKLRPPGHVPACGSVEDCAAQEGLFPVELSEFEELLEGYLGKLEGFPEESKNFLRWRIAIFFNKGVYIHNRMQFSHFAKVIAEILEDMADVAEGGDDALEEAMEEFEREALWKFAATEQH